MYRWWNGDGTFLGNPIGDHPNGQDLYSFYKPEHVWPEYQDFDYDGWYETVMRPIAKRKPSKLYAMKRFNGKQHIDLANTSPFGGMYVPYNLPTYYTTGDPDQAAAKEMEKSMMGMMYGRMFKFYLMDRFMSFMGADGWNADSYDEVKEMKNVEARWMPMDASMEISHAIRREGSLTCADCHSPDGVLDWKELGYTEADIEMYQKNPSWNRVGGAGSPPADLLDLPGQLPPSCCSNPQPVRSCDPVPRPLEESAADCARPALCYLSDVLSKKEKQR